MCQFPYKDIKYAAESLKTEPFSQHSEFYHKFPSCFIHTRTCMCTHTHTHTQTCTCLHFVADLQVGAILFFFLFIYFIESFSFVTATLKISSPLIYFDDSFLSIFFRLFVTLHNLIILISFIIFICWYIFMYIKHLGNRKTNRRGPVHTRQDCLATYFEKINILDKEECLLYQEESTKIYRNHTYSL